MSVRQARRQLGELFANEPHLFAVVLVRGETAHLVSQGRAGPPTCRCLAECRTHGLGVGEAARTDDLERSGGRVIETDMKRSSHEPDCSTNRATEAATGFRRGAA